MAAKGEALHRPANSPAFMSRVTDVDSHEMAPINLWPEVFGEDAVDIAEIYKDIPLMAMMGENKLVRDDIKADDVRIDDDTVWNFKGPAAPSATDLGRRPAVLDEMGIARQLVFPTMGVTGAILCLHPYGAKFFGLDESRIDGVALGRRVIRVHNNWAARITRDVDASRLRAAGIVLTDSVEQMMRDAEAAMRQGIRLITIPVGIPPAGMSPADARLDPFWAMMAKANVPVTTHTGLEGGFTTSETWSLNVPDFAPSGNSSAELVVEPRMTSTMHYPAENFLITITLGGVFERHPDLRFGVLELQAHWVGPVAERMDLVVSQFPRRFGSLSMKPSEYLARNVRVSPFPWEQVDKYLERWPQVADVYCYSSDFPHREGGNDSKRVLYDRLKPFGETTLEKFFVSNGALLFPA